MQKRKKTNNKQSQKNKRIPLGTLPSFNYTEQIRLPTHNSTQLKSMLRSIDLRKPSSTNPYKKTGSRKSMSKSVKYNPQYQPPKLKSLMKQFKELKLLHENERSKSKSPISYKSKSVQKYLVKRFSYRTLRTNPNSQANLTLKLERTIKKFNEGIFLPEDDSILSMKSSTDIATDRRQDILTTEQDEIVDIKQLRQFESTASISFKKPETLAFKTYNYFKQTMAAIKIQRTWRNYQTKKLIQRYAFINLQQDYKQERQKSSLSSHNIEESKNFGDLQQNQDDQLQQYQSVQSIFPKQSDIMEKSNKQIQQDRINMSQQNYDDDLVTKMKMEQLQKWNQIIDIISISKKQGPQALQRMLNKLAKQSQLNKKELQEKTKIVGINIKDEKYQTLENQQFRHIKNRIDFHDRKGSISSQGIEQYDSKKYIDYLNGDVYASDDDKQQKQRSDKIKNSKISKQQQQILLYSLQTSQLPLRLGNHVIYHSESLKELQGYLEEPNIHSSRGNLKKSTSEKMLRRTLSQISNGSVEEEQINLDILTRQFLEGSDPFADNFDMVYSQEKLRSKLAELNNMKAEAVQDIELIQNLQKNNNIQEQQMEDLTQKILQRSKPDSLLHHPILQPEIKIEEDDSPHQMKIQVVEDVINSDQQDEFQGEEKSEKLQTIATILMNNLVLEILRQIATSEIITQAFKKYSVLLKPKVRKAEIGKKKKGFPTNKSEIQQFLNGLIHYLSKSEPQVFKNLQISTGPSALQMLKYMHQCEEDDAQEDEGEEDESNVMVIPNRIFDAFWSLKQKSIVIQIPVGYDQSNSVIFKHQFELLKSFNKIFYRSLFDTFNECLDCQRNFGQYGRPFPWKKTPSFDHLKDQKCIKNGIENARKKMINLSTTYCGLIIEKQQMVSISEQYVQQVHEDRLSRMLASDLMEGEQRWIFYDDEETEILVQISNAVYTQLLIEVIEALYDFI